MSDAERRKPCSCDYPTCASHPVKDGATHDDTDLRSVIITWPRPDVGLYATPGAPLACSGIRITDAETAEDFADSVRLTINLGTPTGWTPDQPIFAEVTRVVINDSSMMASHVWPCDAVTKETADDAQCGECGITWGQYQAWRANGGISYSTFRYLVTEMRIAEDGSADSVAGSVEAEYDLDTGVRREEPQD